MTTTILYIMGHGFSGSTLLALLLGAHPAIATVGETEIVRDQEKYAGALTCSCRRPFQDCDFWRRVEAGMAERGHVYNVVTAGAMEFRAPRDRLVDLMMRAAPRGPLLEALRRLGLDGLPSARAAMDKMVQRNHDFIEVVTGQKGCRILVDASKLPVRALHLRRIPGVRVKVVHLVRDGRAVTCSAMKNLGAPLEAGALSWLRCNQACDRASRRFPAEDWRRLRYEDLCADPGAALAALHAFLGVEERLEIGDFQAGQHVIGNRMRLRTVGEVTLDETWRQTLDAGQRAAVDHVLGPLNRSYGYRD